MSWCQTQRRGRLAGRWLAARGLLGLTLGGLALLLGAVRAPAQSPLVPPIPAGLVNSQAASVVIGQRNYSDISFGTNRERWGAVSGIAITGNKLIVVDSSYLAGPNNNRVLIYEFLSSLKDRLPQEELQSAQVVLGQPNPNTSEGGTSATRMFQPSGVATDGRRLFVSEWGNNRVLIYNQIPTTDGAAADVVVGQSSFTTNDVGTSATTLRRPNGVATDGTRLFIADTLNNRVLIYNQIPTQNGAAASVVLGQPNFDSRERRPAAANTLFDPMSATTDGQRLIITDLGNNRVLIYNQIPTQNGAAADVVVGQDNFSGSEPGNTATRLNFPRYAFSDGTRLLIVDSGNNRILIYNQIPTRNGAAPDIVLGQRDFNGLLESCAAANFAVPFMAASDGEMLFVSDSFNRRVLGFRPGQPLVQSVLNGASFSTVPQTAACDVFLLQPPLAPGGIASIFGTNLADTTEQASQLPLPRNMGGVKVLFNGIEAPLFYVSPTQLNVQVPYEVTGYSASLELVRTTPNGTVRSTAVPVGLSTGAPGIFTWDGTGSGRGVILHADFSPVTDENPARPGETLVAFVTGLGDVDEEMTTGAGAEFAARGSVAISGVSSAGQTVTIFVNGVPYSYTTVEGDLLADVLNNLASVINQSSPVVSASTDSENSELVLKARRVGDQETSTIYSASVSQAAGGLVASIGGPATLPATIEFKGTPQPNQNVIIKLQETVIRYTTQPGDTVESVLRSLEDLISFDPNVLPVADVENDSLRLELRNPGGGQTISYSVSVSPPGVTLTASLSGSFSSVPGGVVIGGEPRPGQIVSIYLQATRYAYTTTESDTLDSIVTALARLVDSDPNVAATADLSSHTVNMTLETPNLVIQISPSVELADALRMDTGGSGVVPATLTVRGSPQPTQVVTAFVSGSPAAYEVREGDTPESIAANLAARIDEHPLVTASAEGAAMHIEQDGGAALLELNTGGATAVPASLTVQGTVWPGLRLTVRLNDSRYRYTLKAGDTVESIAKTLAGMLDADANVVATAEGAVISLTLAREGSSVTLSASVDIPVAAVATPPPGLAAVTSAQHLAPGQGKATNTVTGFIGETLAAVPGDIFFFETPATGSTVTVTLADTRYSYTVTADDNLGSVLTKLAAEISNDPNVAATADIEGSRITLSLRDPNFQTKIGFTVSVSPEPDLLVAITRSATTTNSQFVTVGFAGPVKGLVGLDQINFTLPSDAPANSETKLTFFQNLIVFGSVTDIDIYSNTVTFPVAASQ